jgi:hypothetical protein
MTAQDRHAELTREIAAARAVGDFDKAEELNEQRRCVEIDIDEQCLEDQKRCEGRSAVVGKLRFMAMDTLRPDLDRAFFREVADLISGTSSRLNGVLPLLQLVLDDDALPREQHDALTEAADIISSNTA